PSRLESDPGLRCRCARAVLHGFLRTFEPGTTRGRLRIMAEPGTVALFAYMTARLLPSRIAGRFWFSTSEPLQSSFREHAHARLVGSYARRPIDRNECDSLRRGGYLVDLIRMPPHGGPELALE